MTKITIKKKTANFTILDNTGLKDSSLSWGAKGLLAYLLHLPDKWNVVLEDLRNRSANGRRSTNTLIKELETAGYISREVCENKGKFQGYNYTVYESPCHVLQHAPCDTQNATLVSTKEVSTNTTVTSPKKPSDEKKSKVTEEHQAIAQSLKDISLLRRKKNVTTKALNTWANQIRLLIEVDGADPSNIKAGLRWYRDNWDREYVPVIESGRSLREKYDKLCNAVDRSGGKKEGEWI